MRDATLPMIGAVVGTALAWAAMPVVEAGVAAVVPTGRWLAVHSIEVDDTAGGASPAMRVRREIRRDFTGHWTVTLRRATDQGFASFCVRHGRNDYRAGAALPPATTLDWWLDVPPNPPCPEAPPGRYAVTIAWTLEIPGLAPRVVRAESNVFEVKP